VSASPAPDRTPHEVFIALSVVGLQFLAILHPDAIPFDAEELYNAVQARLIQLEHADRWLDLQYRGYCGGCSVNAGLGAMLFSLFGPSLATWKLVPVFLNGVLAYVGARALRIEFGMASALAWGALLCLAPPTFLELSMTAWGNHFESGVAAIIVLATTLWFLRGPSGWRALCLGLCLSFSLWIGMSSGFLILGVAFATWGRTRAAYILAFVLGLLPVAAMWAYQWQSAASPPFETIYYAGEHLPDLTRIPTKLASIVAPRQLVALFGIRGNTAGWVLGWTSAGCMAVGVYTAFRSPKLRTAAWFLLSFLGVYCLVRFTVWAPPAPQIAPPGSMRYAAPMYGLLFFALSGTIGILWNAKRRLAAVALLVPSLCVGTQARLNQYAPPFPDKTVFSMAAPDFEYARDQASYLLPIDEHQGCTTTDPMAKSFHAYSIGWHETRARLDLDEGALIGPPSASHPAALEGLAAAILSQIDPDEQGGIRTLTHMEARLLGFSDDAQTKVLEAAAWRRNWARSLPEHGPGRIDAWHRRIQSLSPAAQHGAMGAFGRQWAADLARWRTPVPLNIPSLEGLSPTLQHQFIRGLGMGIGERWGPGPHTIDGLSTEHSESWAQGLDQGMKKRWLTQTR
jgi:hypothetical protein